MLKFIIFAKNVIRFSSFGVFFSRVPLPLTFRGSFLQREAILCITCAYKNVVYYGRVHRWDYLLWADERLNSRRVFTRSEFPITSGILRQKSLGNVSYGRRKLGVSCWISETVVVHWYITTSVSKKFFICSRKILELVCVVQLDLSRYTMHRIL